LTWLDWVVAVIILWGAVRGFRRGLVAELVGLAGTVLTFVAAIYYSPALVQWANARWGILASLASFFAQHINIPEAAAWQQLSQDPLQRIGAGIGQLNIPSALKQGLLDQIQGLAAMARAEHLNTVGEVLFYGLATLAAAAAAFLLLLAAGRIITHIVAGVAHHIGGASLGFLDNLAGAVIGLTEYTVVMIVLAGLLMPFLAGVGNTWAPLGNAVNHSILLKYLGGAFYLLVPDLRRILGLQ